MQPRKTICMSDSWNTGHQTFTVFKWQQLKQFELSVVPKLWVTRRLSQPSSELLNCCPCQMSRPLHLGILYSLLTFNLWNFSTCWLLQIYQHSYVIVTASSFQISWPFNHMCLYKRSGLNHPSSHYFPSGQYLLLSKIPYPPSIFFVF